MDPSVWWVIGAYAAIVLGCLLSGRVPTRGFDPMFIKRSDSPVGYWIGMGVMILLLVLALGAGIWATVDPR